MKARIENALKRVSLWLLPPELLYRLWHLRRRGKPRTEDGTTEHLRSFAVQNGVRLNVYWSEVEQGAGPCASLFVLDEEILRIDCFAGDTAHMHLNPVQLNLPLPWHITPRLRFPPGDANAQIARGVFELKASAETALQMNQLSRLRRFALDEQALVAAAADMQDYMLELVAGRTQAGKP